jgi:UDP-N-acetylmuramoyl-tripeptide--D-alanyl-D-alanine ligase
VISAVSASALAAADPSRFHEGLAWLTVGACVAAWVPAGLRWLRVAQREHYLAGSVSRFAVRWWRLAPWNVGLAFLALASAVVASWWPVVGVLTAAVVAAGPIGLGVRGRSSPLVWTRRLRTLAAVWMLFEVVAVVVGVLTGAASVLALAAALAVPFLVDLACLATVPIERRLSGRFVAAAADRLGRVSPTIVAVTGSYGKTSTKGHLAHLLAGTRQVVASPASFNNRAGLSRAVNEHLSEGTQVFIAEMGTYGPGEIAELCRWCRPDVSIITAIGPVHLERFGSEDRVLAAKAEILEPAPVVVLPVDDPRLRGLADRAEAAGKRVVRCSTTDSSADVYVAHGRGDNALSLLVEGEPIVEGVEVPPGVHPVNLACAVGAAVALRIEPSWLAERIAELPAVDHRLLAARSASGATVLDDTYNSNPAGASAALAVLATAGGGNGTGTRHRIVVVTPGMVELGARQYDENRRFAAAVASVADDLVIVGRTNRRALRDGATSVGDSQLSLRSVGERREAVEWVRGHLGTGDTVLYENDLPDHYP